MMDFLYFPEDKTEYIPAVLTLLIFVILAVMAMRYFIKASKKEEAKMDAYLEKMKNENNSNNND